MLCPDNYNPNYVGDIENIVLDIVNGSITMYCNYNANTMYTTALIKHLLMMMVFRS